jgi:hypothetical protein
MARGSPFLVVLGHQEGLVLETPWTGYEHDPHPRSWQLILDVHPALAQVMS